MGQEWVLVNLDKRQRVGLSKREDFWVGYLGFLDNYLFYRPVHLVDFNDAKPPES